MDNQDVPVETRLGPITESRVKAFGLAVRAQHEKTMPLTFPTLYRHGEFEWVKRLGVDMTHLLHTEQQYEYFHPLKVGDDPVIRTYLRGHTSRVGITFITLESEILVDGTLCVMAKTNFVVRNAQGAKS